jgi:hypothetical protein
VSGPLSKNGCKGRLHIAGLILSDVRHTSRTISSLVVDNSEPCCRRQGVLIVPYCGIWNAHLIALHIAVVYRRRAVRRYALESLSILASSPLVRKCLVYGRLPNDSGPTLILLFSRPCACFAGF